MKHHSLDTFLNACGGSEPLCLEVAQTDAGTPQRQLLHQPFALIGRHERADVCLRDQEVSRRHALLQVIAGRTFCLDLGSRTGTHWDGGRDRGWLGGLGPVCVSRYRLCVAQHRSATISVPPNDWDPLARGSLSHYALPGVTLDILSHGNTVLRWPMNRALVTVGSAEACKVRLRGPGVSRFHCALVATPLGIWAIDLQRRSGVEINGTRMSHALLEDGDRIQIGSFTICVRYDGAESVVATTATTVADMSGPVAGNQLVAGASGPESALHAGSSVGLAVERPWLPAGDLQRQHRSPELVGSLLRQFGEMQQQLFEQSLTTMFQMFRTMHAEQVGVLRTEMARMDELNRQLLALLAEQRRHGSISVPALRSPTTGDCAAMPASPDHVPTPAEAPDVPMSVQAAGAPQSAGGSGEDVHLWLCRRMEAIQQERQGLWERIVSMLGNRG